MTERDCRFYTPDRSDDPIQREYSKDLERQRFRESNPPDYFFCPVCLEYLKRINQALLTETEYEELKDWEVQAEQRVPEKTCKYCINQNT